MALRDNDIPDFPDEFVIRNWFEQMDGSLTWKLVPPEMMNPFHPPVDDIVLEDLVQSINALRGLCGVKCQVEGFEVLHIKNLQNPMMCTDHPCIATMPHRVILDFMNAAGISDRLAAEIEDIQRQISHELRRREAEARRHGPVFKLRPVSKKPKVETPKPSSGSGYRVIRG